MNTLQILSQQRIISLEEFKKNFFDIVENPTSKLYAVVENDRHVGTYIPVQFEEELTRELL